MTKLDRTGLKGLKEKLNKESANSDTIKILVGLGTCGKAAGGDDVFQALIDEIKYHELENVDVQMTGCLGLCYCEPNIEIRKKGMPDILYGNVDVPAAKKIVRKHVMSNILINDHIVDKPAMDILAIKGEE